MTDYQKNCMVFIYRECDKHSGCHSTNMYEWYKKKIIDVCLSADEYEAAIRRVAETIGV